MNGRWELLGEIDVDSASITIGDGNGQVGGCNDPLSFTAGLGDGSYEVWAWMVDYGGTAGERIAQVVVTLVDDEGIAEWRAMD